MSFVVRQSSGQPPPNGIIEGKGNIRKVALDYLGTIRQRAIYNCSIQTYIKKSQSQEILLAFASLRNGDTWRAITLQIITFQNLNPKLLLLLSFFEGKVLITEMKTCFP